MPYEDMQLLEYLRYSFWFLPKIAPCHAMASLLAAPHNAFWHDYEVLTVAGASTGVGLDALPPAGRPSATVTRSRRSPSPASDNPKEEAVKKPVCHVFDFAPTRALSQLSGLLLSASDLVAFMECEHLSALDLRAVRGIEAIERSRDDAALLVARKGDEHEQAYTWVVAADEMLRDELTRPPASAFFDIRLELSALSEDQQRKFLSLRLAKERGLVAETPARAAMTRRRLAIYMAVYDFAIGHS